MPSWRRRPSMKPANVKRRLANRAAQVIAALVIAGGYYVWTTWIAPGDIAGEVAATATPSQKPELSAPQLPPQSGPAQTSQRPTGADSDRIETLIREQRSNEIVSVTAVVKRTLPDDNEGSRHQKFLLELPSGNTVLVAHNIDLAPRVAGLAAGDTVTVRGEFEWNERGGVLHWTHHDPAGRHQGGWIELRGQRFE